MILIYFKNKNCNIKKIINFNDSNSYQKYISFK